jgi:hypothetical protein
MKFKLLLLKKACVCFLLWQAIIEAGFSYRDWIAVDSPYLLDGEAGESRTTFSLYADESDTLFAGGTFGIRKWNESGMWERTGGGLPRNTVYAIIKDKRGNLYAGGDLKNLGNAGKWDGTAWTTLGGGANLPVRAFALDSAGNLFAGGDFGEIGGVKTSGVAKWNGGAWEAVGSGIVNNDTFSMKGRAGVNFLMFDKSGSLWAAGDFQFGSSPGSNVAQWDGKAWKAVGKLDARVHHLALDTAGNMYAGGYSSSGSLIRWNGSQWEDCNPKIYNVWSMAADRSGNLYLSGQFGPPYNYGRVMKYSMNGQPALLDSGVETGEQSLGRPSMAIDGKNRVFVGPCRYVGDEPNGTKDYYTATVYRYHDSRWLNLEGHLTSVDAIVSDNRKVFYVGGSFSSIGGIAAHNIARWDAGGWRPLGAGLTSGRVQSNRIFGPGTGIARVKAIALDGAGNCYVGGMFDSAGGMPAGNVAKWDGASWSRLGQGIRGVSVNALAWDGKGNLFAGGLFDTAGGLPIRNLARWNGSRWDPVGDTTDSTINALAFDGRGNLYAGGAFNKIGGIAAKKIALWDGSAWHPLVRDIFPSRSACAVNSIVMGSGDRIYAGGSFSSIDGILVNNIAVLSGNKWNPLGGGALFNKYINSYFPTEIRSIALEKDSTIYIGGLFDSLGGASVRNVAQWNGKTWNRLASGTNGGVNALGIDDTLLILGGVFDTAGPDRSDKLAKFNLKPVPPAAVAPPAGVPAAHCAPICRLVNSLLFISNGGPQDIVLVHSLSGRLLRRESGVKRIGLGDLARQLVVVTIRRGNATYSKLIPQVH